ncbi:MAG TPA: cell division protein SepF [Capsulimonadaceae bacterium]|nr:cell division protein SepF [Capsulimonadaceae bacterium]
MQHNNAEAEEYDDDSTEHRGRFSMGKFWSMLTRGNADEDHYEDEFEEGDTDNAVARVPSPGRAAGGSISPLRRGAASTLRLETVRKTHVSVRRTVQSFEDVRRAIDGLRDGVQQIVNLEQTPADMSERLIDFLNGATYAIDGSVEKIGEQVYLFTPQNITIDVEDKSFSVTPKTPFFDKD